MEHITSTDIDQTVDTVVTIGNFDGVHMGHRKLIETAKEYAEKLSLKLVAVSYTHLDVYKRQQ